MAKLQEPTLPRNCPCHRQITAISFVWGKQRHVKEKWPTPHFMGRYTPFLAFSPSFIVKNAPILQPTNCVCKFVFLFSSSSLLLPFSALFFLFFLCFYKSQSLKVAHQLRCAAEKYKASERKTKMKGESDVPMCTNPSINLLRVCARPEPFTHH